VTYMIDQPAGAPTDLGALVSEMGARRLDAAARWTMFLIMKATAYVL
jgi:hypothetical protein